MASRPMTPIEDQAITLYALWLNGVSPTSELFSRYLMGLFDMLKDKFPETAQEAVEDVAKNWLEG